MNHPLKEPMFNRHTSPKASFCALAFAVLVCMPGLSADDLADKGRAIFNKHQRGVVTVQIVLKNKFSMGGMGSQSNEARQDVTGTVLDSSGLTVLSLSATDPGALIQTMMAGMGDEENRFKMESELSDVKILTEDGGEVSAEVVLRDKDLDLAFIRPKAKPTTPMPAIDFTQSAKADILEQVISLNRLGKTIGRAYGASVERISAIVQRPRLFYVPETSMTTSTLGCPAFTLDDKVLGLFVTRMSRERTSGAMGMLGMQPPNIAAIILPAEDILKAAKQAPSAGEK
jgi:hypothetical protein